MTTEILLELPDITVHFCPRVTMDWVRFCHLPPKSIALDGMVAGGPRYDENGPYINFDHHDGVVREATMSTAMQVYFAIKGGLMKRFAPAHVWVNDTDQDTALAVWLLKQHKLFGGTASIPHISRLLALTDRWDITGGAFPMNLNDGLVAEHNWVFDAYAEFRKSGALARATSAEMRANLELTLYRLDRFMMGAHSRQPLDRRYTVLGDMVTKQGTPVLFTDEIGGNTARYALYNEHGMQAFVARVATRPDGRFVYSIGRRSRFVPFDVRRAMDVLSRNDRGPWGGSDVIGGSHRELGSDLAWERIRALLQENL